MSHLLTSAVITPVTRAARRYDVVIFDVGGTLVGFEEDAPFNEFLAAVQAAQPFKSGAELRQRMMTILSTRRHEAVGLEFNQAIEQWWLTIFNELFPNNTNLARGMWELFRCNYFESLFPDTLPALQTLQARGVPLGIISNYGTGLLDLLLQFDLTLYFDFAIVSAHEGLAKPDSRIFEMALQAAGVTANQALYVGDNVTDDIEGANRVGMEAVLIHRPGRPRAAAPLVIESLLELEPLVFPDLALTQAPRRPYWSTDTTLARAPVADCCRS
jgi:HAD superfamily hydrolase (TIGR01549 family)